jgi:hypothetical protein
MLIEMKNSRRIVICGDSIYSLAIESGLSLLTERDVVRIDPNLPRTEERISILDPHVVIFELNDINNEIVLEKLCRSYPVLILDEDQCSILVLAREHVLKVEINELTAVIEKINQQQDVLWGENVTQPEQW